MTNSGMPSSQGQNLRPRQVCRETPKADEDSGWILLIGDESEDESSDLANILVQKMLMSSTVGPSYGPSSRLTQITADRPGRNQQARINYHRGMVEPPSVLRQESVDKP